MKYTVIRPAGGIYEPGNLRLEVSGVIEVDGDHWTIRTENPSLRKLAEEAFKDGTVLTREDYYTKDGESSAFDIQVSPDDPEYAGALEANLRPHYAVKECWPMESQETLIFV